MEKEKTAQELTQKLLGLMGFDGEVVAARDNHNCLCVNVSLREAGVLIGRSGENLKAFQHILLLLLAKKTSSVFTPGDFALDINNYQKEKENYLAALAKNTAQNVLQTKKTAELSPMSASDRRTIHLAVGEIAGVKSESVGDGSKRRVVVKLAGLAY